MRLCLPMCLPQLMTFTLVTQLCVWQPLTGQERPQTEPEIAGLAGSAPLTGPSARR